MRQLGLRASQLVLLLVLLSLENWLETVEASLFGFGPGSKVEQSTGTSKWPGAERGGQSLAGNGLSKISIRMPDIRPDHGEQYLCMAHRLASDEAQYVVGFEPKSEANRVHHMLVYGCEMAGIFQRDSPNFVWDCSSMHQASGGPEEDADQQHQSWESSFERGPVCAPQGGGQILYAWAMDAPPLQLPPGVGFEVGGRRSSVNFLVLQIHYGHHGPFMHSAQLTDNSGLELQLSSGTQESDRPVERRAGVLVLSSAGEVPPGRSKHEIWCQIGQAGEPPIELRPFGFRVHTHKFGTKVMGAKIGPSSLASQRSIGPSFEEEELLQLRPEEEEEDRAQLIGVGDPQKAQMFYPVSSPNVTLRTGDKVYAACEFHNNSTRTVQIGQTGADEMCNFYIMYSSSPGGQLLAEQTCVSLNPPQSLFDTLEGALLDLP